MSETFELSPRSFKRRKANAYGSDQLISSNQRINAASVFQTVSDTFSGLSRRLFETTKSTPRATQNDSAYGSKEDSLVEEEDERHITADHVTTATAQESDFRSDKQERETGNSSEAAGFKSIFEDADSARHGARSVRSIRSTRSRNGANFGDKARAEENRSPTKPTPTTRGLSTIKRTPQRQPFLVKKDAIRDPSSEKRPLKRTAVDSKPYNPVDRVGSANCTEVHLAKAPEDTSQDHTEENGDTITIQPRSSGRARRPPRRYSANLEKPAWPQAGVAKGIMTPSEQKRKGERKSVVFERQQKQIEQELGFKDIGHLTKEPRREEGRSLLEHRVRRPGPGTEPITAVLETAIVVVEPDILRFEDEHVEPAGSTAELSEELTIAELTSQEDPAENSQITKIKSKILSRLAPQSKVSSNLFHLQTQFTTLHTLLTSTITAGESNSLLLLGSRGSGKSLLINTALIDLTKQHADDFHVVRLNGFIQTDDKLALREIWRQLGREMKVDEDETNEVTSYAETMTSLLGLLAHPEELLEQNIMDLDGTAIARTSKSVIFILDEFDLFTTHPRQTLLYNLFDIAQARKAPIAVIGSSARMDVVDCLEKRVKSRFSHRWLHVPSVKSISGWEEIVAATLCVDTHEEHTTVTRFDMAEDIGKQKEWESRWNLNIKESFLPSPMIQSLLKQIFYTTKSFPDLFTALYIPTATLAFPSDHYFRKENQTLQTVVSNVMIPSPILALLPSIPVLHLTLLICATRLESIHSLPTLNFNITYTHYLELCARAKAQQIAAGIRIWSRGVARGAWEDLGSWEVLVPMEGNGALGSSGKEGGIGGETGMWRVDIGIEEMGWVVRRKEKEGSVAMGGMADVLAKWCREI